MAKVAYGLTISDARGKAGSVVYSKNRAGAFIRAVVNPRQPRTAAQTTFRAFVKGITLRWSGVLTEEQRRGWIRLAGSMVGHDALGQETKRSGMTLFIERNVSLYLVGVGVLDDAPVDVVVTDPGELGGEGVAGSGLLYVSPTVSPIVGAELPLFWGTPLLSVGRTNVRSRENVIGHG